MWRIRLLLTSLALACVNAEQPPNIIFILADDMGTNDIGYVNNYFHTPVMDQMAAEGVKFSNNYFHPMCTASRSALLTGRYPYRTGLQLIMDNRPQCVPTDFKMLQEFMQDEGYVTHLVGKWHLGFCHWNCTPTYRGFDTFYGFYNGFMDYYTHKENGFLDLRDQEEPVLDKDGVYSTHLFTEKAVERIRNHDQSKPFFMYLAHPAPHDPTQAPQEYVEKCAELPCAAYDHKCEERRVFCGMVAALDEGVGNVTQALKDTGMYNNTVIIFSSDNGGPVHHSANNWPLRGAKATVWEGGTKAQAFIHSPLLKKKGYTHDGIIHVTDWYSTMLALAGGHDAETPNADGIDQRDMVFDGKPSQRHEFIYNIDNNRFPVTPGRAAIRLFDWKLAVGVTGFAFNHSWYFPPEDTQTAKIKTIDQLNMPKYHLFNVKDDPSEKNNLAEVLPGLVNILEKRLNQHYMEAVQAFLPHPEPLAHPALYGNIWSAGWCPVINPPNTR